MAASISPKPAPLTGAAAQGGELQEKVKILVVDDLPEKHVVFRTILDELGQDVVSARSGKEALAFILQMEFAVILLDVNMPDIDGLETASLIRQYKKTAQTPIVFITAYVDEVQARKGYALGAVDYIPSPVVPEVLRSKVKVFVELFRMNRRLQAQAAEREQLARAEAARAAAEEAIHRADYLAEASRLLSRSLDMEDTVRSMFDVAVPVLAEDALFVFAGADGAVLRVQGTDDTPVPLSPARQEATQSALKKKAFELHRDGERALAVCPLVAGERALGALLLMGPSERFNPAHVALVREVVSRASIALENARLYAAVQEADLRKNEFLAMLAHELRNPLAPIRNAVHILQRTAVADPTVTWARDVISRQADHMARLVDDLLDVSRIVQGKVAVHPESLALAGLVERSVESSLPRLQALQQTLDVRLPAGKIVVEGDAVRLSQVLSNLLNNASKFSPAGSAILLSASYADGQVCISVKDAGAGIDPAFLPRVFDLFAQADQSLDRTQGGLGIGLTLVKHLVEMHRGEVTVHSDGLGHGAEFTIRLPARLEAVAQEAPAAAPPQALPGARAVARVLVVDDQRASAETMQLLLQMEGHDVRIATEGVAALKMAEEFVPDAILLDIGLPGMNGFEVALRLREIPASRDALIIALTGYGEAGSRRQSDEAGFDFHMVKPANVEMLLSMLADPAQVRIALREGARTLAGLSRSAA